MTAKAKDVAALAGVSVGTVSNVLNRPERVSTQTRHRVEKAIDELGFVRNESARQLRAGSSNLVGFIQPDITNPFFGGLSRHMQMRAREKDLSLVVCDSDADRDIEDDYLLLLLQQRAFGALVTAVDQSSPRFAELASRGVSVVLVDRANADDVDACTVGVDDVLGGRLAVTHLIDEGHTKIAFVGTPGVLPQVSERFQGALEAVEAAGLPPETLTVLDSSRLNVEEGRTAGQRLLGIPADERPTAAFCVNDVLALGLLQEMTSQGLTVPGDLAIVGYDDVLIAGAAAVPLTSVRRPVGELGKRAVDLLVDEKDEGEDHQHKHLLFAPQLIVRASSRRRASSPS